MQEKQTWRTFLSKCIQTPSEKRRIASELGVSAITLTRWAAHISDPRPQNLRQLLNIFPEHRTMLQNLIAEEFPDVVQFVPNNAPEEIAEKIPVSLYESVIHTYITTQRKQLFLAISDLILQEALRQLDPNEEGMQITLAKFVPPRGTNQVRSMREMVGRGTIAGSRSLEQPFLFLGVESLAGYAVSAGRLLSVQDKTDRQNRYPGQWAEWEESAVACPIMREGLIAGCLITSSGKPGHFSLAREHLVQSYAELAALAFEWEDFYAPQVIRLGLMPPQEQQARYITNLRNRIINTMKEANRKQQLITITQAEILVSQDLEEELLQLPQQINEEL
jgi:hypothetical protein